VPKGKDMKRPTPKAGPSRDMTIADSVEHILEDDSLSSEKELWEIVRRKRPCLTQSDGNEGVVVEHEGPPTKRLAMAEAVAAALNKGFEMERIGKEKKTNVPMENVPQNLTKPPKIQTKVFMTPEGKSQPWTGEVGEGSKGILTRSKFNLEISENILKLAPSQPDGVYSALAESMAEDGDWVNGLWNIREKLILVAIYGAIDLGRLEGKITPRSHVVMIRSQS